MILTTFFNLLRNKNRNEKTESKHYSFRNLNQKITSAILGAINYVA